MHRLKKLLVFGLLLSCAFAKPSSPKCEKTKTTASGSKAPSGSICSGDLIFEETFDAFDMDVWRHENTLSGGADWQFQWYTNNRSNSYTEDGFLFIRPTLTSDQYGEHFLVSGALSVHGSAPADECTNAAYWGCTRVGTAEQIINPIKSASIQTASSFAFRYGKIEISAKLPTGDWLWPNIMFRSKNNPYGTWPASGEIDLLQARGNRDLVRNGINIGVEQISSALHFAPYAALDAPLANTFPRNAEPGKGFNGDFHRYQMEWTPEKITFSLDEVETATVAAGKGFWEKGGFEKAVPGVENPWRQGTKMAPFDEEFFISINLAVGGLEFFPEDAKNPTPKPWDNTAPTAVTSFWNARNLWLPTWNLAENRSKEASLQIDYIRIWAL